jgi:hypothetical protein
MMSALNTTEACADGLIARQASHAGGSRARCAPGGEREGHSRLAKLFSSVGARGAQPPRKRERCREPHMVE